MSRRQWNRRDVLKKLGAAAAAGLAAPGILGALDNSTAGDRPILRVEKDPTTGQYDIREGEKPVLRYNYTAVQPPEGFLQKVSAGNRKYAVARSNYIHPLYGLEGEELTLDWSVDHPHHRGIYWAWPEVTTRMGLGDLHALQRIFARPTGKIRIASGKNSARIEAENLWVWEDKTPVVREIAVIHAGPCGSEGRCVDLTFTFSALEDGVSLARRGTTHYGGLNLRLAPIENMKLLHHADPSGANPRSAWQAAEGTWKGATRSATLAAFERPDNPLYPGDYIQYAYLPWFQPTFPRAGTRFALKKGRPLTLRYRLWIHAGAPTADAVYRRQARAASTDFKS